MANECSELEKNTASLQSARADENRLSTRLAENNAEMASLRRELKDYKVSCANVKDTSEAYTTNLERSVGHLTDLLDQAHANVDLLPIVVGSRVTHAKPATG